MSVEVIDVGGGPNGLLMACELALAGVRPAVLERLVVPATTAKANGLVGRVVEALDYRGLCSRLTGSSERPRPLPGFQFAALSLNGQPTNVLPVPQRRIEEVF